MEAPQDEEAQLAAALAELEAKASRHITGLFASTLDDRAAFNTQLTQIREDLAALRAATRDLAILAEEQDSEEESERLANMLKGHQAEYERLQTAFKQANIQARRNTEAAAAAARRAMLAGGQAEQAPARAAGQAETVATSQGITKSLLRTRQLMAQELEHTSATLAAMDASNERLAEGREELRGHRSLFSGSRRLLRALFRSSVLDSMSLYGGLALFFIVVAYILQKRTLYFAPVGKLMAPAAGTAWNASRFAAQRAGQLPSAVLALHRRLSAKASGAALAVDDELPASVDRLLQGEADDGHELEQKWRQRVKQPAEGQQEADASDMPADRPAVEEAAQQWTEAEPDPLADIPVAPDDVTAPAEQLDVDEFGSDPATELHATGPGSAAVAPQDAPQPAAESAAEAEPHEQTAPEQAAGDSIPPGYTAASGAGGPNDPKASESPDQAAAPAEVASASESQQAAVVAADVGAAHPAEPVPAAEAEDGEAPATQMAADRVAGHPDETDAAGGTMAADDLPPAPDAAAAGHGKVSHPQHRPDAAVPAAAGGMRTDGIEAEATRDGAEPAEQPAPEPLQPALEAPDAAAADEVPSASPAAQHPSASSPSKAATGGSTGDAGTHVDAPTHEPAPPPMPAPIPEGQAAPLLQPEPAAPAAKLDLQPAGPPTAAPLVGKPQAPAVEAQGDDGKRTVDAAEAEPAVGVSAQRDVKPVAEQPAEAGDQSPESPLPDGAAGTQEAAPLLLELEQLAPEAVDDAQPAAAADPGSQPGRTAQGATASLLKPQQPVPEALDAAEAAVPEDSRQLDKAVDDGAHAGAAGGMPPLQPSEPEPAVAADGDEGAQQPILQPAQAGAEDAGRQMGQEQQQLPGAGSAAAAGEPVAARQPAGAEPPAGAALVSRQGMQPLEGIDGGAAAEAPQQLQQPSGAEAVDHAAKTDSGAQQLGQAAEKEDNVIYDEQGNKFEWRWDSEAGPAGKWKLYAAGTDTMVHEEPDEEAPAATGMAVPVEAADGAQPGDIPTEVPEGGAPAPAADLMHDEL